MDVIERLTKQGKDLGYEGETLQTFVKEQQIELHDGQKAMRKAEREKREAREAKARIEHEKLELMEKIECEKREAEKEAREADARIEHEKRWALERIDTAEKHDQLFYDMERAKLALKQERIDSQKLQQQQAYEFKCQLQERQHEDELKRLEAQKA